MGRFLEVFFVLAYVSVTCFIIYRGVYSEDTEFATHFRACLQGTEPSQIFRVSDGWMEKMHPRVSYEKYYNTVPFHLKVVYVLAYYVGLFVRIYKFWKSLVWALFQRYVLQKSLGPDPGALQGKINLLLIELGKLALPLTTMSF